MIDYGTEAEHLADIEDYDFEEAYEDWERCYTFNAKARCFSEPYDDWEKKLYLDAKARCFSESDIGKFVIIQDSRRKKNIMPTMFLVDRHKTKRMWWSPSSFLAMVFNKESAAKYQAKKYKYNNARVKKITRAMCGSIEYFEDNFGE